MRRTTPGLHAAEPSSSVLPWPVQVIEDALIPLVYPARLARFDAATRARLASVMMVLEGIIDPHNTAAVLRSCDAFGVGEVHLIDRGAQPLLTKRVTRGTERWLDLFVHDNTPTCAKGIAARGYEIWVADARATATLDEVACRPRVALLFGNEHLGASAEARAHANGTFAVPMRGLVESLNISVAAAITLFTVTRHRTGDLGESEQRALRARYLLESVEHPQLVIERFLRDQSVRG
jgi:tRNA (guanosine-2'-O-)-methyltransferase